MRRPPFRGPSEKSTERGKGGGGKRGSKSQLRGKGRRKGEKEWGKFRPLFAEVRSGFVSFAPFGGVLL